MAGLKWDRKAYRDAPEYAVTCPFCKAGPGYRCTRGIEEYGPSYTHPHRQAAFEAVQLGYRMGQDDFTRDLVKSLAEAGLIDLAATAAELAEISDIDLLVNGEVH